MASAPKGHGASTKDDKELAEAKAKLKKLRKYIESSNPAAKSREISNNVRVLSPSKNAKEIKNFSQVNNEIREEFRKNQNIFDTSEMKPGPTGSGPEVGKKWHNILHRYLNNSSSQSEEEAEIGESVIKALRKNLPEFNFLQSEFPLYGYANKKEKLVVSFWNGKADAIGWYKDNYVIVDWKAVGILDFWKKDKHAYGDYLHQCLVYARLLMLHLDLQRLPYILIVPINNISGNQIHPGMFWDFPDKCKSKLDEWEWTVIPKKTLKLPRSMVVDNLKEDIGNMAVVKVFKGECTLNQMLEALGLDEVKIEIEDR